MLGPAFPATLADAQGGDELAFAAIFRDVQPVLLRYLHVIAPAAAEDVAAENTRLFGHEVAPYLRDLWADQPDHWTPEISQKLVAANAPKMTANGNGATTHNVAAK